MITVGHIAKTYGVLPSVVFRDATTYDLMITDVYTTWEQYQRDPNAANNFDPNDLQKLMEGHKK